MMSRSLGTCSISWSDESSVAVVVGEVVVGVVGVVIVSVVVVALYGTIALEPLIGDSVTTGNGLLDIAEGDVVVIAGGDDSFPLIRSIICSHPVGWLTVG